MVQALPPSAISRLQNYQIAVFEEPISYRDLHATRHRLVTHTTFSLHGWLFPGGHMLRFTHQGETVSELVTPSAGLMPEELPVEAFQCMGEHDYELKPSVSQACKYMTTVQTETLSANLFRTSYRELRELGEEVEGLMYEWPDPDSNQQNLSILDIQRYRNEAHVQSFHLIAEANLIIRSQTLFTH